MEKENSLSLPVAEPAIPVHETPSFRLAEHCADYLSDTELLSLILNGTMSTTKSLGIAREILAACGSLKALSGMSLAELQRFPGIGVSLACRIQSALALARRLHRPAADVPCNMSSPRSVAEYMQPLVNHLRQEEFHALLLDTKHNLVRDLMVTRGLVDRSQVHAREVFRPAIQETCSRILLAHNHPSGDPTPSAQDLSCTKNLKAAGKVIGIEVLDHVIIGERTANRSRYWLSFREENLM
mgnify:CR=1 FL=1